MTLTTSAREKSAHYGITESEIAEVLAAPESRELGNRAGTLRFRRRINGRSIVVVTNWAGDVVITLYVPDDEWNAREDDRVRLTPTKHAQERMRLVGLALPELEYIVTESDSVETDPKGNLRFRKYYDRRDITVVTDPNGSVVITVFPTDTIWLQTGGAPEVSVSESDALVQAHEVIAGLGERVRALQAELAHARDEAAALRELVDDYEGWLATAPRRSPTTP